MMSDADIRAAYLQIDLEPEHALCCLTRVVGVAAACSPYKWADLSGYTRLLRLFTVHCLPCVPDCS